MGIRLAAVKVLAAGALSMVAGASTAPLAMARAEPPMWSLPRAVSQPEADMGPKSNPDPNRIIAGPTGAALTIEEFADFTCPYCSKGAATIEKVLKEFPNDVNLVFRNVPLDGHQPGSGQAAKAFAAVELQSTTAAYAFEKALFENQDQLISQGDSFLFATATGLGIDLNKMKADMDGSVVAKMIADDTRRFSDSGFRGTPSYLIGKEALQGAYPYRKIKAIVEKELGR
jgi:protein-disulfide isomerase